MQKKAIIIVIILLLIVGILVIKNNSYSLEEEEEKIFQISLDNITNMEAIETASYDEVPVIKDNIIKNVSLNVKNPGDYITFDFEIKNTGKKDAKISKIIINNITCDGRAEDLEAVCNNISVDLTYKSSNKEVKEKDIIFANSINPINATIIYNNGPNVQEDIDVTIKNMNIEFEMVEATN